MFFYLSKYLSLLFFPYTLFFLIAIPAARALPPGRRRRLFRIALLVLYLLSINPVATLLMRPLEDRYAHRTAATAPTADAVVVLAGMVDPLTGFSDRPEFLGSVDRILAGEELLRAGRAPVLVISGGSGLILQTGESEAVILERWLRTRGIHALIESTSRNTAENAIESTRLAKARGWKTLLLVTSAMHMPRSVACFERASADQGANLNIAPFPVDYYRSAIFPGPEALFPAPASLAVSTMAIKEYVGLVAYRVRGYL